MSEKQSNPTEQKPIEKGSNIPVYVPPVRERTETNSAIKPSKPQKK